MAPPRRMLLLFLLASSLLLAPPAQGEDEPDRTSLAWERGADRLLAAAAEGPEALARAVRSPDVDPWILVDVLAGREAWDVAEALVGAWKDVRFERLGQYLEALRREPLDAALREVRDRAALAAQGGDLARALGAIDSAPPPTQSVPAAWIQFLRGIVLASTDRAAEAVEAFRLSADLAEHIGWLEQLHAALRQGAVTAFRANRTDAALELLRRQIPVAEKVATPEDLAGCVINLGSVCARIGRWEEAVTWLRRGLDLTLPGVGGDPVKIRNYRLNDLVALGQLHVYRGEYAHAAGILDEAPALAASLGREAERGLTLLFLGQARLALNLVPESANAFAEAANVFHDAGVAEKEREALRGYASCLIDADRAAEALTIHERITALADALDLVPEQRAMDLGELALALQYAGHPDEAQERYEAAFALASEAGDEVTAQWIRLNEATLLFERGRSDEARALLEGALAYLERSDHAYMERHALRWLGEIAVAAGDNEAARAYVDRGLSRATTVITGLADTEAARARTSVGDLVDLGIRVALARGDAADALRYAESGRGLGFLEMLGARSPEAVASIPNELKEAADVANQRVTRARATYEMARAAGNLKAARVAKKELDEALDEFQIARQAIERVSKLAVAAAYPQAAHADEIARALSPNEALVAYVYAGGECHAIVLRADAVARIVPLGPGASLTPLLQEFLAALEDPQSAVDPAVLRERLAAPLALAYDVRRVVVVPFGPLNEVPFATLMPEREVVYVPSGTVLLHLGRPEQAREAGILALGDPDYSGAARRTSAAARRGGSLVPLPATAIEVKRVAAAPQDVRLLAADATEAGLREALGSRPHWHAVHVACHGLVDSEKPALSALALTPGGLDDGYLTALEIGALTLSTDLVVLSACETARGSRQDYEGIVGLTRSFMLAGAPRVLCSLWPVDDQATQALMVRFYELWNPPASSGRAPLAPAAALREAQRFVRENAEHPEWKHPYFWAAWVLWGLPGV